MKKRLILSLLIIALLAAVPAHAAVSFTDVLPTSWYYDAVKYVSEHNAMNGFPDGSFDPNGKLTRAMAVTVLSRICGGDTEGFTAPPFGDVDMTRYYGVHVAWAKENGIIHGMTDTEFAPNDYMTREQICVMLSNFFDRYDLSTRNTAAEPFADEDNIAKWAYNAVKRMHRGGIVNGRDDNSFDPKGEITRAEFSQIILNTNMVKLLTE